MSQFRSELVRQLTERGFVDNATDLEGLDELASKGPITAYIGFDCTADSLHVGHQLSIMLLRLLQRTGHRPIALVGGGTTKVGDPSGKDESRQLLDDGAIAHNMAGVKRSLEGFLELGEGAGKALLVNNAEWLDQLRYIDFLREYGRHFTINRMLKFDSVRQRLDREQPLTFLEFNYMIMQAYDFLELARRYDCHLQAGGSDQWGNIVNGVELGRRAEGRALFGVTTPLITTAAGAKMGKTAAGAVWLNEDPSVNPTEQPWVCHLHYYKYYQFWRNTDDADVGRFLRLFTELPLDQIEELEKCQGAELNEAKKVLAYEATKLCRGEEAARAAAESARTIFEAVGTAAGTSRAEAVGAAVPTAEIARQEFERGMSVVELFRLSGLVPSKGEARRLIRGGGARLNEERVTDEEMVVGAERLVGGQVLLSAGKKRHARVRAV